jgi:hypothetical protein
VTRAAPDRFAAARAVADAVLYEGYVLYPYRASARKNQLRWQFGVLTPEAFSAEDPSETSWLGTECLLQPGAAARVAVRIRCLQLQHRAVEVAGPAGATFAPVEKLEVDGQVYVNWDEAVERVVHLPGLALTALLTGTHEEHFGLASGTETEIIRDAGGATVGRVVRIRQRVTGLVRVHATLVEDDDQLQLVRVSLTVHNLTAWEGSARRPDVLGHALVAVHAMLASDDGTFVSLLDPPPGAAQAASGCRQQGLFPVLIGGGDVVLASPIILYDRPEIAPESPGDLYDATEIDEILALRVLTLTDDEKAEARATDPRAAAIIDRCDEMPAEMWARLHGAIRAVDPGPASTAEIEDQAVPWRPSHTPAYEGGRPFAGLHDSMKIDETCKRTAGLPLRDSFVRQPPWWDPAADAAVDPGADSVMVGGVTVKKGTGVRLQPSRRADAHDMFLRDRTATVAGVFLDVDGSRHVAVTLDGDPAGDELGWPGRFLYFHPEEITPLVGPDSS